MIIMHVFIKLKRNWTSLYGPNIVNSFHVICRKIREIFDNPLLEDTTRAWQPCNKAFSSIGSKYFQLCHYHKSIITIDWSACPKHCSPLFWTMLCIDHYGNAFLLQLITASVSIHINWMNSTVWVAYIIGHNLS